MLRLTSSPVRSPLVHIEQINLTLTYDHNKSIRLLNLHSPVPSSDAESDPRAPPRPCQCQCNRQNRTTFTDPAIYPGSLRTVNVPKQLPEYLGRQLTFANLGTEGDESVSFPLIRQRNPPAPKRARFIGVEIIIPPEKIPGEVLTPLNPLDTPANQSPSSIAPHEDTYLAFSETLAPDEFPDSPSAYILTNTPKLFASTNIRPLGWMPPESAEAILAAIGFGHLQLRWAFLGKKSF